MTHETKTPDVALEEARRILDLADLCECGHSASLHVVHAGTWCTWRDGSESCTCEAHTPVAFVVTRKETK